MDTEAKSNRSNPREGARVTWNWESEVRSQRSEVENPTSRSHEARGQEKRRKNGVRVEHRLTEMEASLDSRHIL